MKITYINLVNFAGIYAGTGLREFELDLSKGENVITMLLGANGSGKTTLLSNLNPFRGTNDERDKPILKNEKGLKELHIQNDNDIYVIVHHYGTSSSGNKSFIMKNGEELNENGGIRTFDAVLEKELGVTTDYFKIGRIGSNVTSFIGLSSTDRKKFIGNFIPNIDSYLTKFEIAKKHYQAVSRDIKSLEGSLAKLNDLNSLLEIEKNLRDSITNDKNLIDAYNKDISRLETLIFAISESGNDFGLKNELNQLLLNKNDMNSQIDSARNNLNNIINKYPNLANYTDEMIEETVNTQNTILEQLNSHYQTNETMKSDYTKRLVNINEKINRYISSEFDEDVYNNLIEESKKVASEVEFYNNELSKIDKVGLMSDDLNKLMNIREDRKVHIECCLDIKSRYTNDILNHSINEGEYEGIVATINKITQEINSNTRIVNSIEDRKDILDSLSLRPSNCNIDVCPFISSALSFKLEYDKANEIHDKINELKDLLNYYQKKLDYLDEVKTAHEEINNFSRMTKISIYDLNEAFSMDTQHMSDYIMGNIDNQIAYLSADSNFNSFNNKYNNIIKELESLNKIKVLNEQIELEFKETELEKVELEDKIKQIIINQQELNNSIVKNTKKLEITLTVKNSRNILNERVRECEILDNDINIINDKILSITNYTSELSIVNNNLNNVKNRLIPSEERIKTVERDVILVKEYSSKLNELSSNFENYKLLRDSLDPKMGIPLVFIDNYLTDISEKANELLDSAYNGKFQIEFDITDKEFLIKVIKSDGTELKDITEASQGELSMTTVSLSMALIESSLDVNKYNILYLDEVDATLSTDNRRMFIDILDRQIEKLGLEQVFVISHNNEFFSHSINMVLMKNADIDVTDKDLMDNKTILYKYEK